MIRLLFVFLLLAALGMGAAWLSDHPGDVVIHWFDYRIDTSFSFLLIVAFLAAIIVAYFAVLTRRLLLMPTRFSERRHLKHYQLGLTELTHSVAALAASDTRGAAVHTRKAEKLLGRTPLTLLLSAQVAKSQGDDDKTRLLLTQMLDHKETEYLAARSLSDAANKQHLFAKALTLAQRAQSVNSKATDTVVGLHIRLGQWQEALAATRSAVRKGALTRAEMKRLQGLIYLAQGQQLLDLHQSEGATYAARYALKNLPDFAPAILFAAQAHEAAGNKRKAEKLRKSLLNQKPRWSCSACGHETNQWETHCPHCDTFDTLG